MEIPVNADLKPPGDHLLTLTPNKREGRLYWTSKNIAKDSDVDVWAAHRALSRGMQEISIFSRVGSQNKGAFL